jgi:hypothetical protein
LRRKKIQFGKILVGKLRRGLWELLRRRIRRGHSKGIKGCKGIGAEGVIRVGIAAVAARRTLVAIRAGPIRGRPATFLWLLLGEKTSVRAAIVVVYRRYDLIAHVVGKVAIVCALAGGSRGNAGGLVAVGEIGQLLGVFPPFRDGMFVPAVARFLGLSDP